MRLAFEELKVDDDGYVRSILSCPVIVQGEGCVVTGTFTHLNSDVLELTFANSDLVLQPTALHPLWSEDRNDWVRAGLLVGEHLRSESGPLEIATIQWVDGTHQVFNLEVAGDHTYLVGAEAVLSHNAEGCNVIGFAADVVETAFPTLQKGGGHVMRHLQEAGVISSKGSPQKAYEAFKGIAGDILTNPSHTAAWRVGGTEGRAFIGTYGNNQIAVIVATDGAKQGEIVSAILPDANQLGIMLSR